MHKNIPAHFDWHAPDLSSIKQDLLSCKSWQEKYIILIKLARISPDFPELYKNASNKIIGCETDAWLVHYIDTDNDKYYFSATSNAKITNGIIALTLFHIQRLNRSDLLIFDFESLLNSYNIMPYLSPSRSNGILSFFNKIKDIYS